MGNQELFVCNPALNSHIRSQAQSTRDSERTHKSHMEIEAARLESPWWFRPSLTGTILGVA